MVERKTLNLVVVGSIPTGGEHIFLVSEIVNWNYLFQLPLRKKIEMTVCSKKINFLFFKNVLIIMCKKIHLPGIEPGTYRVLGGRHNQLDHRCFHTYYIYFVLRNMKMVGTGQKKPTTGFEPMTSRLLSECSAN